MIRINLLPADIETHAAPMNPMIPVGVAALATLIAFIGFHVYLKGKMKELQREVAAVKSNLDRYQPIAAQVEALEAAKTQLTNRKNVIQQLESERVRYPQFMDDFVKLLPGNLWLGNLTTIIQPGTNVIQVGMDVTALDNYAIADLISNLETSQIFSEIELGTLTTAQQAGGGQTIAFHMNATYKRMDPMPNAVKKS